MRAKDIMTSPVFTVEENTPVEKAAELMTGKAVNALPVIDESGFRDDTEQAIVAVPARTVPGVAAVDSGRCSAQRNAR